MSTVQAVALGAVSVTDALLIGMSDLPPGVELRCWPTSMARQDPPVALARNGALEYATPATITTLTAFLVLELTHGSECTAFVVRCALIDPPVNRQQRLIAELIGNGAKSTPHRLSS